MRWIAGKQVYTELHELVDPAHSALVLVDIQRDFIDGDGVFAQLGVDVSLYPQMCERARALLHAARAAGVAVFHVQNTMLRDGASDSPAQLRFNLRIRPDSNDGPAPFRYTLAGSSGQEFVGGFEPLVGEPVVQKHRSSAFWGTSLHVLLRSVGIETLIIAGCTTEGCVESTARDAMFNDLYVVIAEDAVASGDPRQHEASLLLMRHRFDVATCGQINAAWTTAPAELGTP